ncbi:MAG TPA: YtxH domain-containing protein [Vicinamibacterales bacterium]|nr:YtxH domain-containing protein [Vicinamibacterales bacterium]
MARYQEDSGGGVLAAFLLGALAGAAVALMYAPGPGEETRRRVAEGAREGREKAMRAAERGRAAFEKARQAAGGGTEEAL